MSDDAQLRPSSAFDDSVGTARADAAAPERATSSPGTSLVPAVFAPPAPVPPHRISAEPRAQALRRVTRGRSSIAADWRMRSACAS